VTHGVLAENTILKMAGSSPGEGHHRDPLADEEGPWAIHGVTRPGAWSSRGHPC